MKKIFIGFCLCLVLLILLGIGVLGYLGFVPGLSSLLGSNKPRNLGITYTSKDSENAYKKNSVTGLPILASKGVSDSIRYEGKKDVVFTMNSAEITALINSETWKYMPISDVQIKVDKDGGGEASGILHIDKVLPFVSLTHTTDQIKSAMVKYHISGNPPFYLKGKVSVTNNQVTIKPERVEIGRLPIPSFLIEPNIPAAISFVERRIAQVPNLQIISLRLYNGTVNFNGVMPEKEFKFER